MKRSSSNFDSAWEKSLEQARGDRAPTIDLPALLRAVAQEPPAKPPVKLSYLAAFRDQFADRQVFTCCLIGAAAIAGLATWPLSECWQELAWVPFLLPALGGGL